MASVSLVTQLVGSSVVFSVSFLSGLLCRERQTGSDHRCHQWHWAGGGRRARRTRRERRHRRSQQGQDAHCLGSRHGGGREGTTVETFIADLSSQAAVRRLAAEVLDRYPKLDVLVNNAGAMYGTRQLTKDGIELTWAVNHLAPFLLSKLLLHRLKRAHRPASSPRHPRRISGHTSRSTI
jgi:NAD(P)-dependent dehydrogenase (short-subunit alcohol dehydrogenase family)